MLFRMICLYRAGVLIPRDALEAVEAHTGNLILDTWTEGGAWHRPVKRARLLTTGHSVQTDIVSPLFEPVIAKVSETTITLQGFEISHKHGEAVITCQNWLLRSV
jgi:hypothetical protein